MTCLEMVEMSNLLSQAFEDSQGSNLLCPLEPSCPSTALYPPSSCPSVRECLPLPPPAKQPHCSSFRDLLEHFGPCVHPIGGTQQGPKRLH